MNPALYARYARPALLILACLLIAATPPGVAAKTKQAVLEVNLKNPGDTVGRIVFSIQAADFTAAIIDNISVSSPAGKPNRFPRGSGAVTLERNPTEEVVTVTLDPLRIFRADESVQFVLTVPGIDRIRILQGSINNNGTIIGAAPTWYNKDGTELAKPPKLPGFQVVARDAGFTLFNDASESLSIRNLRFLPDITLEAFEAVDIDALLAEDLNSRLLDFPVPPRDDAEFLNLLDPEPGNLFIALGQILDSSGGVAGAFAYGIQLEVPEPASLLLVAAAIACLLSVRAGPRLRPA